MSVSYKLRVNMFEIVIEPSTHCGGLDLLPGSLNRSDSYASYATPRQSIIAIQIQDHPES